MILIVTAIEEKTFGKVVVVLGRLVRSSLINHQKQTHTNTHKNREMLCIMHG